MIFLLTLLAGSAAKLYDDIRDNALLKRFRNKLFLKVVQMLHMGFFSVVSFYDPLFFLIIYFVVFINIISDTSCYSDVNDKALVYATACMFPLLNFSKITKIEHYWSVMLYVLSCAGGAYLEATHIKEEYSRNKLFVRLFGIAFSILVYIYFLHKVESISIIQMYVIGYLFTSVIVQAYCLYFVNDQPKKIREKRRKPKKQKS